LATHLALHHAERCVAQQISRSLSSRQGYEPQNACEFRLFDLQCPDSLGYEVGLMASRFTVLTLVAGVCLVACTGGVFDGRRHTHAYVRCEKVWSIRLVLTSVRDGMEDSDAAHDDGTSWNLGLCSAVVPPGRYRIVAMPSSADCRAAGGPQCLLDVTRDLGPGDRYQLSVPCTSTPMRLGLRGVSCDDSVRILLPAAW
jgi:hypothetical protein